MVPFLLMLFQLLIVFGVPRFLVVSASCPLCFGNDTATNMNGTMVSGISCSYADSVLLKELPEAASECPEWQVEAYRSCGCPRIPNNYCSMCQNSAPFLPSNSRFKVITLNTIPDKTYCEDALFSPFSQGYCLEYKRAAHFCGCPNATEPICNAVCLPPSADAADRLLPPNFNMTCQEMYTQSRYVFSNKTCNDLQSPSYDLIDEDAYCCYNEVPSEPLGGCDLCNGKTTTNPTRRVIVNAENVTLSCQELQTLSFAVTDDDYCRDKIRQTAWVEACCLGLSSEPTESPVYSSIAPSASPVSLQSQAPSQSRGIDEIEDDITSDAKPNFLCCLGFYGFLVLSLILIIR